MNKMRNLPNFITSLRIIGALSLIFIKTLSMEFLIIYTIIGITDVLDGFIARKTNTASEFGAKLDSVADLLFYSIMGLKILPSLVKVIDWKFWIIAGVVVAIRIAAYIVAFVKFHCFSSLHTYLSKLTGITIFFTPYFYFTDMLTVFCIVLSIISFASSIEQLLTHVTKKTYRSNIKSIFDEEDPLSV